MPVAIAIKGNAVCRKIADPSRSLLRHERGDVWIDDAGACVDRVGGMLGGVVVFADRSGNSALRPHCSMRLRPSGAAAMNRHRQRRELQRREQSGKTGADDDNIAIGTESRLGSRLKAC